MTLIIIGVMASLAALAGGLLAFRFQDKLHVILGFSAGVVLGVAFFDLIPETIEFTGSVEKSLLMVLVAFLVYMILDRAVFLHPHADDHCHNEGHNHTEEVRGKFGATSLSVHSFLDGAAVGLAYQAAPALGIAVAVAIFVHGFSDGINTVTVIRRHGGGKKAAFKWLLIDAVAPLLGVISTFFFVLPSSALGFILAMFAGFFIYLGASDLLPESRHGHQTYLTTLATVLGAVLVYVMVGALGA